VTAEHIIFGATVLFLGLIGAGALLVEWLSFCQDREAEGW
jgi:hypothetical protein